MFEHPPLDPSQESIRLVRILPGSSPEPVRCELVHVPHSEADYVALSYQWGDLMDLQCIELNGCLFNVTKNLHHFLVSAREKVTTKSVWIDAICIDQTNVPERNEQVRRMGQIYSMAGEVWVWLGTLSQIAPGTSVAAIFDLLEQTGARDLSQRVRLKLQVWRAEQDQVWLQVLDTILSQGYWSRLWVTQEFLKPRSIAIWIGDDLVPGDEFSAFVVESGSSLHTNSPKLVRQAIRDGNVYQLCKSRQELLGSRGNDVHDKWKKRNDFLNYGDGEVTLDGKPLEQVLSKHSMKDCTDWHDSVYGLLSLMAIGGRIPVDY
ncbi:MAG: hypothetical protein Q9218_002846 [Villophora microphyllina]